MIQVTRQRTVFSGSGEALAKLRNQFARQNYLRLPELFEPELLGFIQRQVDRAEFHERVHEGIASNKELCMTGNAGFGALLLLMNDEKLFQIVQNITQCPRIRCFEGRVYRVVSGLGHHDSWHNDIGEDRLLGMSVNLSKEVYNGGILQIRERESGKIISEVANVGVGDAVIFRLTQGLQHRITQIEGNVSKTAFAGWFRANPDFPGLLREQSRRGRESRVFGDLSRFSARSTEQPARARAY